MLSLIMRAATIVLMLVCAAAVGHTGAHAAHSPHAGPSATSADSHAGFEARTLNAASSAIANVPAVADAAPDSKHPCAVSGTAAKFGWTTTQLSAFGQEPEQPSPLGRMGALFVDGPPRSLLLMTCVCRT